MPVVLSIIYIALLLGIASCKNDSTESPSEQGEDNHLNSPNPSTSPSDDDEEEEGQNQPLRVVQISAGHNHTCVLVSDGRVKCWGGDDDDDNEGGRDTSALGHGNGKENIGDGKTWNEGKGQPEPTEQNEMGDNLQAVDLGSGVKAKAISAGGFHTCALLTDAKVKCWGGGYAGKLGQGNTNTLGDEPGEMGDNLKTIDLGSGRTAKDIIAGYSHTCALLDNDAVKCWGYGAYSRLGQGNTDDLGDNEGEMGNNLNPIALGSDVKAKVISAGNIHTCALLTDATVKCWGGGQRGRLGHNSEKTLGDRKNKMGDNLPIVNFGAELRAVAIAAGAEHTCVLLDGGTMKCWGHGDSGQLGQGNTERLGDGKDAALEESNKDEMGDNLKAINLGSNVKVKSFAIGNRHTCALLTDGMVKCWGANSRGQLGQGHTDNLGDNEGEMGNNLKPIALGKNIKATAVTAGYKHTCALLDNHKVKCWGNGAGGPLGQGNEDNLGDNTEEMGDNLPYVDILGSAQ